MPYDDNLDTVICEQVKCKHRDTCQERDEFVAFEQYMNCVDKKEPDYREDEFFLFRDIEEGGKRE